MAKKEKIAEVLQQEFDKGHYEAVTPALSQVPEVIRIKTEQGAYSFPNDKDMWKSIDSRQKALDRVISNRQNYGDDRGRCGVFKDNKTALDLGLLKGRPDYLRCAYRSWLMAQNAPEKLRRYVYHNLLVMCNRYHGDAEKFYLQDISDYTFQVLPPAWRKCMDEECPELKDVTLGDVLEQLTPSFKEGQTIARMMIGGRFVKCKIVGVEYNYQFSIRRGELGSNPFVMEYRVQNVDDNSRYPHTYSVRRENAYPAFHAEKKNK